MNDLNRMPAEVFSDLAAMVKTVPLPAYDATPDPSLAGLKELDLRDHLVRFEGLSFNGKGTCLCPVHAETDPSFEVKRYTDGHWYWFDWHNHGREGFSGTIIDYYVTIKGLSVGDAIRQIREREGIQETVPRQAGPVSPIRPKNEAQKETGLIERDPRTVKVRPIPWLWQGVIPTHMATAITGDAGEGKSLVAVDITARITRGKTFPIYDKAAPPVKGHVFYVTSEGVPEMILVPRLMAAGADLGRITIIEGVCLKKGDFSVLDITRDLPIIEKRARDFPDLKSIIIDPVASFLPERINPSQQNQVRQAMDQISNLAYKLGVAAIPIMHFSKTPGVRANYRTSGSVQFMASVKMSWSVVRREGDPRNTRLLVPQKSNITGGYKSLSFAIHGFEFPAPDDPQVPITTARIIYGDIVDEDPETLISPPLENDNHATKATKFLLQKLRDGTTLYASDLINEAESQGIPKWALYKAKDRLGIDHDKEDRFQGRTFWFWPREKEEA